MNKEMNFDYKPTQGFLPIQVVFLILKCCHVIDWDWIYICIPALCELGTAIFALIIIILLILQYRRL